MKPKDSTRIEITDDGERPTVHIAVVARDYTPCAAIAIAVRILEAARLAQSGCDFYEENGPQPRGGKA